MLAQQLVHQDLKQTFLAQCLKAGVLKFGNFTLKSGRVSPYFLNAGLFYTGTLVQAVANAYANTLANDFSTKFDVIFGPAYKGIPLAAITVLELTRINEKYGSVAYSFNRKEAKDHGEGGNIVGAPLRGKRVVIMDDVITAGTAIREAIQIIKKEGGELVGILVLFDRQEKAPNTTGNDDDSGPSAISHLQNEYNIPVLVILTLDDVLNQVQSTGSPEQIQSLLEYREKYGAVDL